MKEPTGPAVRTANVFATLGYLAAIVEWAWALLIAFYPVLESQPTLFFPDPNAGHDVTPVSIPNEFSPVVITIAAIITSLVLLTIAWLAICLPRSVGQKSAEISQKVAQSTIPVITHRKKISAKKRQKLSYRIILIIKTVLVILPVVVLIFTSGNSPLAGEIVWTIGWILTGFTALYFAIQALIVRLTQADTSKIW